MNCQGLRFIANMTSLEKRPLYALAARTDFNINTNAALEAFAFRKSELCVDSTYQGSASSSGVPLLRMTTVPKSKLSIQFQRAHPTTSCFMSAV